MRKRLIILLTAGTLAVPVLNATAATTQAATQKKVVTKKYTGSTAQADRWGTVTINVTVRTTTVGGKKTRKYIDLGGSFSYHTSRSQYIMSQSLPYLRQEFLSAQSPNVQLVSGATYTSQAFEQSLQSALAKINV